MGAKPHKSNGRVAKTRRQEAAAERLKASLGNEQDVKNVLDPNNKEN